ncbi:hypothetical protein KIH07_13125 [Hydrogenophaga taeniospiralis]|uniref:hypothetical protein n=1 Tax=Hydrogenophaga taeniospiralis TaxID=65656 RepID=UPI001CFAB96A|nr:hypothetical protein [Hydrogenophaga taeniospiralis]MCB4364683.1 hypothetical protein [Hydrogenophaga taeniospiralis]
MAMSRHGRLVVLAAVTVALAVAAWLAMSQVSQLNQARVQVAATRAELAQLRGLMPVVEQRERYARQDAEIRALAERDGIDPARWSSRRVQRAPSAVSRLEAERLLSQQLGGGALQWFAADRFDVAVVSPTAGLFTPAQPDDRGFSLELSGVVYFPLGAP